MPMPSDQELEKWLREHQPAQQVNPDPRPTDISTKGRSFWQGAGKFAADVLRAGPRAGGQIMNSAIGMKSYKPEGFLAKFLLGSEPVGDVQSRYQGNKGFFDKYAGGMGMPLAIGATALGVGGDLIPVVGGGKKKIAEVAGEKILQGVESQALKKASPELFTKLEQIIASKIPNKLEGKVNPKVLLGLAGTAGAMTGVAAINNMRNDAIKKMDENGNTPKVETFSRAIAQEELSKRAEAENITAPAVTAPVTVLSKDKVYNMSDSSNDMGTYLKSKEAELAGSEFPLKARFMAALIQKESSGDPKSTSPRPNDPSWGLTQPTPGYITDYGKSIGIDLPKGSMPTQEQIDILYDPQKSIDIMIEGIKSKLKNFKYSGDSVKDAKRMYKKYNGMVSDKDPRLIEFERIYKEMQGIYN